MDPFVFVLILVVFGGTTAAAVGGYIGYRKIVSVSKPFTDIASSVKKSLDFVSAEEESRVSHESLQRRADDIAKRHKENASEIKKNYNENTCDFVGKVRGEFNEEIVIYLEKVRAEFF